MTPARWLIDTSAIGRLRQPEVSAVLEERILLGQIGISIVTELEIGYSSTSTDDYRAARQDLIDLLLGVGIPSRAESRAREVQAALVERGHHRSAGVADLLVAATAEMEALTVLHYDADFDLIAAVTGQSMEWVVPRGSVD